MLKNTLLKKILTILLVFSLGCSNDGLGKTLPAYFVDKDGSKTVKIKLVVAKTQVDRDKGLMFIKHMPKNKGMLFVFENEKKINFWMKNTYIPLDMIFLDKNKLVVGILENVPILNEKPRSVNKMSKYVVELNSGMSKKIGIQNGSRLVIPELLE